MATKTRRDKGGGSIFERDGKWIAQVHDGYHESGRPKYKQARFKTKTEAQTAVRRMTSLKEQGKSLSANGKYLVDTWLNEWLETEVKPKRAYKTYETYQIMSDKARPHLGRMPLDKITPRNIDGMFNNLEGTGATSNTLDGVRRTLRNAFNLAVKFGYMRENPILKTTPRKVVTKPKVYFTAEQVGKLLEHLVGSPIENLVKFTLATGMRSGEARGLTWDCVNLETKCVFLQHQIQRIDSKLTLVPLKTDKSRRMMPLFGHSLQSIVAERELLDSKPDTNPLNVVFTNPEGRPFDPKYVNEHFHVILERAGLPITGLHSLRHSAATFMLMSGLNLHVVSRFLGHSQVGLTSNLYGHVLDDGMRLAAEQLHRAFSAQTIAENAST